MCNMNAKYVYNVFKKYVHRRRKMEEYKTLYLHLFNAITDSLRAMEAQNFGQAKEILVRAQQEAEEQIMDARDV